MTTPVDSSESVPPKRPAIDLRDVRRAQTLLSWGLALFVIPLAGPLAVQLSNRTRVTPNQITTLALTCRLAAAAFFVSGQTTGLLAGAVFYYLSAVLDAVDGPVARLTGQGSPFGRYYDHVSDLLGDILVLLALAFNQGMLSSPLVVSMVFMQMTESYVSYLTNAVLNGRLSERPMLTGLTHRLNSYLRYRSFLFGKNLKTFFSFPDYALLVFVFFPIIQRPGEGIVIGFFALLMIVPYTFFSTFVAIHCGGSKFP